MVFAGGVTAVFDPRDIFVRTERNLASTRLPTEAGAQ